MSLVNTMEREKTPISFNLSSTQCTQAHEDKDDPAFRTLCFRVSGVKLIPKAKLFPHRMTILGTDSPQDENTWDRLDLGP